MPSEAMKQAVHELGTLVRAGGDVDRRGWFCERESHVLILNMRTYRGLLVMAIAFGWAFGFAWAALLFGVFT